MILIKLVEKRLIFTSKWMAPRRERRHIEHPFAIFFLIAQLPWKENGSLETPT